MVISLGGTGVNLSLKAGNQRVPACILLLEHHSDGVGLQEPCPRRRSPVLHLLTLSSLPLGTLWFTHKTAPSSGHQAQF